MTAPTNPGGSGSRRLLALLLATTIALGALATVQAATGVPNVLFRAPTEAPLVDLAMNADGSRTVLADAQGGITLVKAGGGSHQGSIKYQAPSGGLLANAAPRFDHAAVTPAGHHWAGALAYESQLSGRVYGFDESSAEPIWIYDLPAAEGLNEVVKPTALAAGGPYYVVGTDKGHVVVLDIDDERMPKSYFDLFTQDGQGRPFGPIRDVDVSANGKSVLIGTARSDVPTVHLFTNDYFVRSFDVVTAPVNDLAISGDAKYAVVAAGTGSQSRVWLLDATTGARLWDVRFGATATDVSISSDGGLIAVGLSDGKVQTFLRNESPFEWRKATQTFATGGAVRDLAVAPGGEYVLASAGARFVYLLSPHFKDPLWSFDAPGAVPAVGASVNADWLGAATDEGANAGSLVYFGATRAYSIAGGTTLNAAPGETRGLVLKLANSGNRADAFTFEALGAPNGWTIGLPGMARPFPGRATDVAARITPSETALAAAYPITLRGTTERGDVVTHDVTVGVPEVLDGVSEVEQESQGALPGEPVVYRILLRNAGNLPNEAIVTVRDLPAGWASSVSPSGKLRFEPFQERIVTVTVTPSPTALPGDIARVKVSVAWLNEREEKTLIVQVVEKVEDLLDLPPLGDNPGRRASVTIQDDAESKRIKRGIPGAPLPLAGLALVGAALAAAGRRRRNR